MIQIPNNPVRTKSMKIFIPANLAEPVCSLKDDNEKTVALKLASKRGGCISPMKNVFDISAVKTGKYTLMCNEVAAKEKLVVEKPMYKNVTVKEVPRLRQAMVTIEFDKLPPGFTFMLCQKEVCGKMKQIGKSLIGYVNTMEAVGNKVKVVLKDCDGNQISVVIPVATCQKPDISKAFIRGKNLILEFGATIQLHKEVNNAMVDPKSRMIIFKDFDTSMISEETVTIPKNVFAAKCSKEFNANPVSHKLEPLLCEILTVYKNGMPIYRPKGGPHLKLIDENSDIVADMKDKAAIDMNQVKSKLENGKKYRVVIKVEKTEKDPRECRNKTEITLDDVTPEDFIEFKITGSQDKISVTNYKLSNGDIKDVRFVAETDKDEITFDKKNAYLGLLRTLEKQKINVYPRLGEKKFKGKAWLLNPVNFRIRGNEDKQVPCDKNVEFIPLSFDLPKILKLKLFTMEFVYSLTEDEQDMSFLVKKASHDKEKNRLNFKIHYNETTCGINYNFLVSVKFMNKLENYGFTHTEDLSVSVRKTSFLLPTLKLWRIPGKKYCRKYMLRGAKELTVALDKDEAFTSNFLDEEINVDKTKRIICLPEIQLLKGGIYKVLAKSVNDNGEVTNSFTVEIPVPVECNFELENESPKCGDLLSIIVTPKEEVIADKAMCAQVSKNGKRINKAVSRDLTSPLEIKFAAPARAIVCVCFGEKSAISEEKEFGPEIPKKKFTKEDATAILEKLPDDPSDKMAVVNGLGDSIISSETEESEQKRKRRSTEDSCQYGKPPDLYCDVKNRAADILMTEELPDEVLEVKATCAKLCGQVTSCPKIIQAVANQFKRPDSMASRKRRAIIEEASTFYKYDDVDSYISSFSSILYPVNGSNDGITAFMEDMIDMQRSQCWLFENEGIDTPIVAENIAMITYAEDFSTMSSDAAIGNATVYFKDAMKTKYENWECNPTENCSGLYLTILSMLQSENGMGNLTEPLSDGAPYQEMELISNVHVIRFFTTNGNYERVSLDDAINMYSVEILLTKDSPSNPMCHQWNKNKIWDMNACQKSEIKDSKINCTCSNDWPTAVFSMDKVIITTNENTTTGGNATESPTVTGNGEVTESTKLSNGSESATKQTTSSTQQGMSVTKSREETTKEKNEGNIQGKVAAELYFKFGNNFDTTIEAFKKSGNSKDQEAKQQMANLICEKVIELTKLQKGSKCIAEKESENIMIKMTIYLSSTKLNKEKRIVGDHLSQNKISIDIPGTDDKMTALKESFMVDGKKYDYPKKSELKFRFENVDFDSTRKDIKKALNLANLETAGQKIADATCEQVGSRTELAVDDYDQCYASNGSIVVLMPSYLNSNEEKERLNEIDKLVEGGTLVVSIPGTTITLKTDTWKVDDKEYVNTNLEEDEDNAYTVVLAVVITILVLGVIVIIIIIFVKYKFNQKVTPSPASSTTKLRDHPNGPRSDPGINNPAYEKLE